MQFNYKIEQVYIARRLYKFGKSFQTLNTLIEYRKSYNPKRTLLQIPQAVNEMSTYVVYISYIIFNLFENLMVFHQLGFFKQYFDHKILKIITHAFWSVGLVTQLIYYLNRLRANFRKEAELKTQIQNGMTTTEFMENISLLSRERYLYGMVIARFVGDLACALQKTHIPEKIVEHLVRLVKHKIQQRIGGMWRDNEFFNPIVLSGTKEGRKASKSCDCNLIYQYYRMINKEQKYGAVCCYYLFSIMVSITCLVNNEELDVYQLLRLIVCVLSLICLGLKKYFAMIFIMNKLALGLCGLFSSQEEGILQFCLDNYLMDEFYSFQQLSLQYAISATGFIWMIYMKHYDDPELIKALSVPFMLIGPQVWILLKYYFDYRKERKLEKKGRIKESSGYLNLRSPRENLEDVLPTCDINQLIRNISLNSDHQYVLKQIQQYQEQIWKIRLDAMPIGIAIISNTLDVTFMNKTLYSIIRKNFQLNIDEDPEIIYQIFTEQLQFKRIDMNQWSFGPNYDWPPSALHRNDKSRAQNEEELQSLKNVLQRLADGSYVNSLNTKDRTLELFSTFESTLSDRKQIFLDCKVLYDDRQNMDYLITIQDFTRQNELSRLEEQNEFKTKVVQSFSHELRTPLNSAMLFLKCALMDKNTLQEIKIQYLDPCYSVLNIQNHLINDIIDFSNISRKMLELKFNVFEIQKLIDEITQQFLYEFQFKHIGLAFEIDQSVPQTIKSDYQRLLQVLTNIIQNALKFSEKGYVLVKLSSPELHQILFQVQDEGVGLDSKQLSQLNAIINQEQQYRMTQSWQGFGLIICQMLLRYLSPMNNSNLIIQSNGVEQGTCVTFSISNHLHCQTHEQFSKPNRKLSRQLSLPVLKAQYGLMINIQAKSPSKILLGQVNAEQQEQDCNLSIVSFNQRDDIQVTLKRYQSKHNSIEQLNFQPRQRQTTLPQLSNLQICSRETGLSQINICCSIVLSVDDEVFNQKSLQLILGQSGIDVDIVFNGRQALERIIKPKKCSQFCTGYKLILMDCQMPIMDGWQTTMRMRELMEQRKIPTVPIVGLTAFTSNEDIQRCLESGMTDVLHKPLNIKLFQNLLTKLRIF